MKRLNGLPLLLFVLVLCLPSTSEAGIFGKLFHRNQGNAVCTGPACNAEVATDDLSTPIPTPTPYSAPTAVADPVSTVPIDVAVPPDADDKHVVNDDALPCPLWVTEMNIINKMNAFRAKNGLPPLRVDGHLIGSARRHARWMASHRTMQHTSANVGENIAMGQATSDSAVNTWINSPPHRGNMLSRSWTRVGAAAYTSPEGRIYWCLQFLR